MNLSKKIGGMTCEKRELKENTRKEEAGGGVEEEEEFGRSENTMKGRCEKGGEGRGMINTEEGKEMIGRGDTDEGKRVRGEKRETGRERENGK